MRGVQLALVAMAMTASAQAMAAPVVPLSYSAPPGGYTYGDSGGELTDGFAPTRHWTDPFDYDYSARNPYVGWQGAPTLTFNFAPGTLLGSAIFYFDDYGGGAGVNMPDGVKITINGTDYDGVVTRNGTGASPVTFTFGSGVTTDSVFAAIDPGGEWTFMSEATFDSVAAVPEPGEWAMIVAGLGIVGAAARRRKRA